MKNTAAILAYEAANQNYMPWSDYVKIASPASIEVWHNVARVICEHHAAMLRERARGANFGAQNVLNAAADAIEGKE